MGKEVALTCIQKDYNVALIIKEPVDVLLPLRANQLLVGVLDLRDTQSCLEFVSKVIHDWKRIDAVVFYAGITPISSLTHCSEVLFDDIFEINLKSTFFLTQILLNHMVANGGGSFVFFGTAQMESGQIDRAAYAISKGAIKVMCEHLARCYAQYLIRSNMVVMGWTPTEGEISMRAALGISKDELVEQASTSIPMGRMLNVNDPVPAVMYFLSDESCMVTGSTIRVTGGEYI